MGIEIFDKNYSKEELYSYFGEINHISGIRKFKLLEGKSKDCEIIEVRTGSGLVFEINSTRGLDIGRCSYKNIPISYQGYNKEVHPSYYETFSDGWLRSFNGGLLVTCGLKSIGKDEIDGKEILPLHGRISNTPSDRVNIEEYWENDKLFLKVFGKVRESKALNYNLELSRSISIEAGTNKIVINDTIENMGFDDEEFMLLYHFNIGHPILDEFAKLISNSKYVIPRDEDAKKQKEKYYEYCKPTPKYKDIVYYHKLIDKEGLCTVAIINEKINMGVALYFNKEELDCFTQWKFNNRGNYVAGIEPGNAYVNGRSVERKEGRLKSIKGREKKEYKVEVEILVNKEEIDSYKEKI